MNLITTTLSTSKAPQQRLTSALFATCFGLLVALTSGCANLSHQQTVQTPTLQPDTKTAQPHTKIGEAIEPLNKTETLANNIAKAVAEPLISHPIIWGEIQNELHLAAEHLDHYKNYINYYVKNPNYLKRVSKRAKPYLHFILSEVKKRKMPFEMALLPIVESGFRPIAKSHQSALGLWQFIPSTGHQYGLEKNWWYDGRQDTVKSTRAALDYLTKLYKANNNDWLLALASYNAGLGNVYKAARKYRKKYNKPDATPTFWDIKPFLPKETQNYVPQLLAVSHVISHANTFNLSLEPIENKPYFSEISLTKQISLNKVSLLSGVSESHLNNLNPGFLGATTPPSGPFNILLPVEKSEAFKNALAKNKSIFDIQWIRHKIRAGESLSVIAQKYRTTRQAIKKLNKLKSDRIRADKTLLIPVPSAFANDLHLASQKNRKAYTGPTKIHTVKAGDSLWRIARYYNVDTRTLCKWNRIGIKSPLHKGQKIIIRSAKYDHKITVTIQKNQSLWTLAKKYNVTTQDIARWNKLKKRHLIQPGTKIVVWQPIRTSKGRPNRQFKNKQSAAVVYSNKHTKYKVQPGDNLWTIAKQNSISTKYLARYNKLSLKSYLKAGQVLKIPLKS